MLSLASDAFHNDPFIKFQKAQLALELGDKKTALEMLNKLRNLEWSDDYYPTMKQNIADFTEFVQAGGAPSTPMTQEAVTK